MSNQKPPDQPDSVEELTPLKRYLSKLEKSAREASVPVEPEKKEQVRPSAPVELKLGRPAGFWARFFAYMIDLLIIWTLCAPLKMLLAPIWWTSTEDGYGFFSLSFYDRGWVVYHFVLFFYFGWFYAEKGATPGKLLLGLQVIEASRRKRLSYWRTFFRESLGKYISGVPLALGYLIAAFRGDRKALHDLLFDTQVLHQAD